MQSELTKKYQSECGSIKRIEGHCDVEWGSPKCSKDDIAKTRKSKGVHLPCGSQNLRNATVPSQNPNHLSPTIKFKYNSPSQRQGFCHSTPLKPEKTSRCRQKQAKCNSKKKILSDICNDQDMECEKEWDEDSFFDESTLEATQRFVDDFLETDNQVSAEDSFFDEYTLQVTQAFVDNFLAFNDQVNENKALLTNTKEIKPTNLPMRTNYLNPEASETKAFCEHVASKTTFHLNGTNH